MAYLYRHIRLDKNIPFYIGIGTDNNGFFKRAYNKRDRNQYWKRIVNKAGYEVEIIFNDITLHEACEKEKEFIKLYGRKDLGNGTLVNGTDGGEGLFNPSKAVRERISKDSRIRNSGEGNPMFGKCHTEETKIKIRESRIGKYTEKDSPNYKRNFSVEWRKKIGESSKGRNVGMKSGRFNGFVIAYKNGCIVGEYEGINDCSRKLNICQSSISLQLSGKYKHAKGYIFKRVSIMNKNEDKNNI